MAQTGAGADTGQIGYRVLGIYLNDHLAARPQVPSWRTGWRELIGRTGKTASSSARRSRSRRTAPPWSA